jgi:hypothetical protein
MKTTGVGREAWGMRAIGAALAFAVISTGAWAKLPPPAPLDEKAKAAAEEKKAKDAAAAEKAKADQAAAEEYAIKNYQGNMKKAGKAIPKPTPIVTAAAPAPAAPGAAPAAPAAAPAAPAKAAAPAAPAASAAPKKP